MRAEGDAVDDRARYLADIVRRALAEDAARRDATTKLFVDASRLGDAVIRARAPGIVSGHDAAREAFAALDESSAYAAAVPDGGGVAAGAVVARVYGRLRAVLSAERTALNFLRHLSGIATATAAFVERVRGTGTIILDTRKTLPGLRLLEKEAVVHGGGRNHRADLASMILVKDNHIAAAGGLGNALAALGAARLAEAEIEVASLAELRLLAAAPPRRVMLDNFEPDGVRAAIAEVASWPARPEIEVSGGITLETIASYARPGVDFISVGSITCAAPPLDMSLELEGVAQR